MTAIRSVPTLALLALCANASGAAFARPAAMRQAAQPGPPQMVMVQPATPDADALAAEMRTLADQPTNLDALVQAGRLTLKLGDPTAAAVLFTRAEKVAPTDPRPMGGLGAALVHLERPGEALRLFDAAVAHGADPRDFASDRGLAYDLIGQQDRAQRDYRLALESDPNDAETTRRYALSLGIAGRRDAALKVLDPLLRASDRAAWRDDAFIQAMDGDADGADKIAAAMLPATMAGPLQPFFAQLGGLSPTDRAFAVQFGEVRATPERLADARMAPPLPALAPEPVQLAAATPQPATEPAATRRKDKHKRTELAATLTVPLPAPAAPVATAPAPVIAAVAPRTPVAQPGFSTAPTSAPQVQRAPGSASTLASADAAATASAAPRAMQAGQAVPATATASQSTAAANAQMAAALDRVPAAGQEPPAVANVPTALAAADGSGRPVTGLAPPAQGAQSAPPTAAANAAAPGAIAQAGPVRVAANPVASGVASPLTPATGAPPPAAIAERTVPDTGPSPVAANPDVRTAASAGSNAVRPSPQTSPRVIEQPPRAPEAAPSPSSRSRTEVASAGPERTPGTEVPTTRHEERDALTDATPPRSLRAARKDAADDAILAHIIADISVPGSELGVVGARSHAVQLADTTSGATIGKARETVADHAKTDDDASDGRSAKAKAADAKHAVADRKAAADKKAADKAARAEPPRIWVQVAGGAYEGDLPKAWARVKGKAPDAFAGRSGWTTPLNATNRVLAGPFKTEDAAQDFVNTLSKKGMSGFVFTSDAGQKVTRLPAK